MFEEKKTVRPAKTDAKQTGLPIDLQKKLSILGIGTNIGIE